MEKFEALFRAIEALTIKLPDDRPLREVMPGEWPTVGDLRELMKHLGK
jgi:hypothetical protein